MPSWSPVLDGQDVPEALEAITAISAAVCEIAKYRGDDSIFLSEVALLQHYIEKSGCGIPLALESSELIERSLEALSNVDLPPSLFGGFIQVAWTLAHLRPELPDDAFADVDDALDLVLTQKSWHGTFDLTIGLAGLAVYSLERSQNARSEQQLIWILEHLDRLAQWNGPLASFWRDGRFMGNPGTDQVVPGCWDLGMAHGVPGPLAIAAQIVSRFGLTFELPQALAGWMLAHQNDSASTVEHYPSRLPAKHYTARTAWCYGDPGVACAFALAGRALEKQEWVEHAVVLGRSIAARPMNSCGVIDAGLCHGATGLAQSLLRLELAERDPKLREASKAWYRSALAMRSLGTGVGGYSAVEYRGPTQSTWLPKTNLIDGAIGVGLSLLAAVADISPDWDRIMLMSARP